MLEHQVCAGGGYLSGESTAGGWQPPGPQFPGCRAAHRWGKGRSSCGGTERRAACTGAHLRFHRCPPLRQRSTRGSRLRKQQQAGDQQDKKPDIRSFTGGGGCTHLSPHTQGPTAARRPAPRVSAIAARPPTSSHWCPLLFFFLLLLSHSPNRPGLIGRLPSHTHPSAVSNGKCRKRRRRKEEKNQTN